ncbi:PilZ domain-containing protein [Gallaecimonas sp. GXIMD1310]|uniref:PilZ domain-containing protein n=1 Tax=Gallaecimonas sp. GXIMD1310 TaxID=3131926 RepID=UPI0032511292
MIPIQEQRDHRRMKVDSAVTLQLEDRAVAGTCADLSATGMAVAVTEPVAENTLLVLHMAGGLPSLPPFEAQARVKRCEPVDEGFRLALEFDQD